MILQGVRRQKPYIGVCYANAPPKGGVYDARACACFTHKTRQQYEWHVVLYPLRRPPVARHSTLFDHRFAPDVGDGMHTRLVYLLSMWIELPRRRSRAGRHTPRLSMRPRLRASGWCLRKPPAMTTGWGPVWQGHGEPIPVQTPPPAGGRPFIPGEGTARPNGAQSFLFLCTFYTGPLVGRMTEPTRSCAPQRTPLHPGSGSVWP